MKKEVKRKEEEEHWKVVTDSREKKTKKEEQLSSIIQTKKAQLRSLKETKEKANMGYELSIIDYAELEVFIMIKALSLLGMELDINVLCVARFCALYFLIRKTRGLPILTHT